MNEEESVISRYLKEINKIPLLNREQEYQLAREARAGDGLARSKLAEANLRFVVNVARKYQNQGLAFEDMVSEGNLGLLSAIDHFDPEKGYHLISYAVWWIRQAILKAICEKSRMIRLPMNRSNELMQIERMRKGFIIEKGKEPAEDDIARITGIKTRDVKDLLAISRDVISLETPIYGDDNYLGDYLEDDNLKTPEYHAIADYLSSDIDKLLDTISEKEADILRRRFGLNGKSPESLKDIGVSYGLTKERIRQIEKKALERLRHPVRRRMLVDYVAA